MRGTRRQKITFWFCVWFFGTLAFIAIGLAVQQLLAPPPPNPITEIPTTPAGQPTAPAKAKPTTPSGTTLTGPLQEATPKEQINGVEIGFPHSTAGAVSAAASDTTEAMGTLDPDRTAAVMRMIADPSFQNAPQYMARGPVNLRKGMGLPASGPVPAGASFEVDPVEYQVRDVTPDRVTVLLLCEFTTTTPDQGTTTSTNTLPMAVHWADGDWKLLSPSQAPSNESSLTADPDSPKAASLGWNDLEPAGS